MVELKMNAGAYEKDTSDFLRKIKLLIEGEIKYIYPHDYKSIQRNNFPEDLFLEATLNEKNKDVSDI